MQLTEREKGMEGQVEKFYNKSFPSIYMGKMEKLLMQQGIKNFH